MKHFFSLARLSSRRQNLAAENFVHSDQIFRREVYVQSGHPASGDLQRSASIPRVRILVDQDSPTRRATSGLAALTSKQQMLLSIIVVIFIVVGEVARNFPQAARTSRRTADPSPIAVQAPLLVVSRVRTQLATGMSKSCSRVSTFGRTVR